MEVQGNSQRDGGKIKSLSSKRNGDFMDVGPARFRFLLRFTGGVRGSIRGPLNGKPSLVLKSMSAGSYAT
jgi:hypothetical protein